MDDDNKQELDFEKLKKVANDIGEDITDREIKDNRLFCG